MHALSLYQLYTFGAWNLLWICLASMLTTATSSDPAPMSIGHASTCVVSLQGVTWVTGVGHCGSKGCTRDSSLAICRSIGGRTAADSCREDSVTTLFVDNIQAHAIHHKQKGTQNAYSDQVCTCAIMQAHPCILNYTQMHECACTIYIYAPT